MSDELEVEYKALTSGAGYVVLEEQSFVCLTGQDRQKFFHNFCTNEIKQLEPGQGCEAFVLNPKGKILGFVYVIATPEELLLTGHGNQASRIIGHLDSYLIREDVEMTDVSKELNSIFVCGEQASRLLGSNVEMVPEKNGSNEIVVSGVCARIVNLELAGFGYMIICAKSDLERLKTSFEEFGITECSLEALHVVRVEQQTPWYGIDVDDSNLPQELQRDEKAINFNKGCYLGQETVARIDARGKVNQLLVGLKFQHQTPARGDVLSHEGKSVGRVTSIVHSYRENGPLGLGYVRREFQKPGATIDNVNVIR